MTRKRNALLCAALLFGGIGSLCGCSMPKKHEPLQIPETNLQQTEIVAEETAEWFEIEETDETDEIKERKEDTPEGVRPDPAVHTEAYVLLDMENILQNPELPTGCESVSLTMVLNYLGFELEKTTIADDFLVFAEHNFAAGYMGDPHSSNGAGVFPPGLVETADRFLAEKESEKRAFDLSDSSFSRLYDYVAAGMPVIVWNSMYMEEPVGMDEICEHEGKTYRWFHNEHCVVFCGFDEKEDVVYIQDPLEGLVERDAAKFEEYYDMIGQYAMVIH